MTVWLSMTGGSLRLPNVRRDQLVSRLFGKLRQGDLFAFACFLDLQQRVRRVVEGVVQRQGSQILFTGAVQVALCECV